MNTAPQLGRRPGTPNKGQENEASAGPVQSDSPASRQSSSRRRLTRVLQEHGYLPLVLLGVIVVGSQLTPYFVTPNNLALLLVSSSTVAVLAIGQFIVVVTGGIDLSVGSVAALSAVVLGLALRAGLPSGVAILLALLAGVLVGVVNGIMIVFGGIAAFIATLAMLSTVSGVAFLIQDPGGIAVTDTVFRGIFNGQIGGIRTPIVIIFVVLLVSSLVMGYSGYGRRLYALGGNLEAARLSGLPVRRDRMMAYVLSGGLAALSGLMIAAQLGEGSARLGQGYELTAIAAVVVGGASLYGGTGNPFNSVVGALITASIVNIMNLIGVQSELQLVVTGAVIIVAVFFTSGRGPAIVAGGFKRLTKRSRPVRLPD